MRPYRGKTKDGKWVKGWYIEWKGLSYIIPLEVNFIRSVFEYFIEVIPETVGQYTGRKDKNGVERGYTLIVDLSKMK